MSRALFDPRQIESRYALLEECPEALIPDVIASPLGTLDERIAGLLAWRRALLAGEMPSEAGPWPPTHLARPALRALRALGIVRFCRNEPELVDALLADMLAAVLRASDGFGASVAARLRELARLKRLQADADNPAKARKARVAARRRIVRLHAAAHRAVQGSFGTSADEELVAAWQERVRAWSALSEVFDDLGGLLGLGWDLSRGVLRHQGWAEMDRLRQWLARMPQLREVIRALGRLHQSKDAPPVLEQVLTALRRTTEEVREARTPWAPSEVRGIDRSGEISRMLPSEAVLLAHPRLRLLWHAKRAERTLLGYRVEGVLAERVASEITDQVEQVRVTPRPERGPIVICLDTSGSMAGLPEQVAKAVTLEALRVAHAERRACYLYAFGGAAEISEHELDLTPDGIGRLLTFLVASFHGGTDVHGPVLRALARLQTEGWRRADVLVASDGEFPVTPALVAQVRAARAERESRIHGLLIGGRGDTGMAAICDPLHRFDEWATLAPPP